MYIQELRRFPKEVVEKMLERQYEQTGKKDISVFEDCAIAVKEQGGFDWFKTIEGYGFWANVIWHKDFAKFYQCYPKHKIKTTNMTETIKCGAHIKKSLRDKFAKKTKKNKTSMSAEVKRFIESYVKS